MTGETLWDWHAAYGDRARGSLQDRYDAWRATADGETVYVAVRDAALRLRRRGFGHYGIRPLVEAARYAWAIRVGPDAAGWKINNDWCSRLARELMAREPELLDLFETRELKA